MSLDSQNTRQPADQSPLEGLTVMAGICQRDCGRADNGNFMRFFPILRQRVEQYLANSGAGTLSRDELYAAFGLQQGQYEMFQRVHDEKVQQTQSRTRKGVLALDVA